MPQHRPDSFSPTNFLRTVPEEPGAPAYRDSGSGAFSNSSIERDAAGFADRPNARDFELMLTAYMWSGGMARSVEVAHRLEDRERGNLGTVGRLIDSHAIFAFDWRGSLWVPMFQFEPHEMYVKPPSRRVLEALDGVFDGWALAAWFIEPNLWLHGRRPVDLLDAHFLSVLAAARGDRFIATDSLQASH